MFVLCNPEILLKFCDLRLTVITVDRIVCRFGRKSLNSIKQRPDGSVGVEALLDHLI